MSRLYKIILILVLIIVFAPYSNLASSKIRGRVIDKGNKEAIPGANVLLLNTNFGAATDIDGNYIINGVPPGNYSLQISYIGYRTQKIEINVPDNRTLVFNAELEYIVLEGEEIVITAQAEGQVQAINQQKTALSVKNIVSAAKIQELPESNAAEAVGRLPGISLLREGGEGNKVVIRGLPPEYNKIAVNGVSMASTSFENRSVDLRMISPNILEGIEVSKTAMADQEADQLGGTVNFLLRGAPKKPTLNATIQGGYNGLRGKTGNYYYILGGGTRFFDNKLGVLVQGNLEKTDRSSNSASAGYQMQSDTLTLANSLNLQDISRTNKRMGGLLVLDYETPLTKIKLSNTLNNIDITSSLRQENFDIYNRNHNYGGNYSETKLFTMVNTLNFQQTLGNVLIVGSLSYSKSKTDVPKQVSINAYENNAFVRNWSWNDYQIYPFDIVTKAVNNISKSYVNQFYSSTRKVLEEETTGNISFENEFKTDLANIKIKLGGEFKHKYKKHEYEQSEIPLGWQDLAFARLYLSDRFNLTNYDYTNEDFPYAPFIDYNYDAGDFKSGANYIISNVPNLNTMLEVFEEIKNLKEVRGKPTGKTVYYDYTNSILDDYYGYENYYAAYILPTITFGNKKVTFIPGLRYEYNLTNYTANRSLGPGKPTDPFLYFPYTAKKYNEYFLPMFHIKYQVFDWFDIRASYTNTLARPDYIRLIPTWNVQGNSITWNNVDLKPAQSKNIDLFFTFYTDNIGLFSIGAFQKQIKGFVFYTQTWIVDSSYLRPEWPESVKPGGTISSFTNSPDIAKLWGIEAEWQSNFWYLPGVLRGLVLNVNYTYTNSRLKYPKWSPIYEWIQKGPIKIPKVVGTKDEGYYDRLLNQPTHVLNFSVGYDYEGFSIRCSMQFKSDVFISSDWYEQLRQTTDPLTLWDVKIRQKLPYDGLQIYLSVNNFTKSVEQTSNFGTGWFTNRHYYGLTADLGITYNLN